MKILFVTSEVSGLFKKGGLGDVSHELPLALSRIGIDVSVVLPFYKEIKAPDAKCMGQLAVDFDGVRETIFVFKATIPKSTVPIYLFRHPRLDIYGSESIAETFTFFSLVVAHFYLYAPYVLGGTYDIIHCNDWHTALIPMILGEKNKTKHSHHKLMKRKETLESKETKSILTIHNLMYQGDAHEKIIEKIGLPRKLFHIYDGAKGNYIKILREGLEFTDIVTTVSPTYAKEITTGGFGEHMDKVLADRSDRVVGILNGIDIQVWNPEKDTAIAHPYSQDSVIKNKALNKQVLRKVLNLPEIDAPLLGFIGRIESRQKGTGLIREMVEKLGETHTPYQLVMLGTGNVEEVEKLHELTKNTDNMVFVNAFDEKLARRIYAGSDMMLVPSKFEPCGLIQLIAMRYGAVPIVRKTGGLADSVEDGVTGFIFDEYDIGEFVVALDRAFAKWKDDTKWKQIVVAAMKEDFGWDASAKKYAALYKKLI